MTTQERLNELFSKRGMPTRCSETTGISQSLISNYRNGTVEPSFVNMVLIADFFDVSLDWLACRPGYARDAHKLTHSPTLSDAESGLLHDFRYSDETGREIILENAASMAARFPSGEIDTDGKTLTA